MNNSGKLIFGVLKDKGLMYGLRNEGAVQMGVTKIGDGIKHPSIMVFLVFNQFYR